MEYIQSKPNNIDVYVNEFHTRIKTEFEKSINKIYNEELSVYRQVIETVVKLPFIQEIIEENKALKAKLKVLEDADNVVKLEIFDKPVSKTLLDVEKIPFSTNASSEANSDASSDDDADDESSGDSSEDDDDKPIVSTANKEETTKPTADKEEEQPSADEESEEQPSADEESEEQPSADEEDQSPTFPVKIIVNKLDKEEDNLEEDEEVEEEEEEVEEETTNQPSADMADQEEVETETEEVEEVEESDEEPSVDKEEEPSADEGEVIEIEIDGKTYYCESEENGNIYEDDNGEVGNVVGEIKDGEATFFE